MNLNSIWSALTTPNEPLVNIIGIPFYFIDALVCMLLFTTILNIETTRKKRIIYILSFTIIGFIFRQFIPSPYSTFANIILLPTLVLIIFRTTLIKALLAELIPAIISACLETIIVKIFFVSFGISREIAFATPIYRFSIVSLIYLCIFIIYLITKKLKLNITLLENIDTKTKLTFICTFILGLVVIGLQFYLIQYYNDTLPVFITFLGILVTIAYFFMTIYGLTKSTKLELTSMNLEEAKLYNKTLNILHDNVRAFKHDFHNIVQGIGGYIQTNDMEGLQKYYSELLEDCNHTNNLSVLSPNVVNNPAIYNVLADKYYKADENGIKINLEIFLNLNTLHIKIYEFTRILGILLDNAIEATSECDKKNINITIRNDESNHRQIVYIENTYKDKKININRIFEKGFSTKEKNSGLGLWEIRQILNKNNNLNLHTDKNSEYFIQQLEIYY